MNDDQNSGQGRWRVSCSNLLLWSISSGRGAVSWWSQEVETVVNQMWLIPFLLKLTRLLTESGAVDIASDINSSAIISGVVYPFLPRSDQHV